MAADRLGRPPIHLGELVTELGWPSGLALGLIETAGGARSPMAHDADGAALAHALAADVALLVADAGLGTIHSVRAAADSLAPLRTVVMLNRYDETDELHVANREWLRDRDALTVVTDVPALAARLG
jgi:dethiobiotin synthetase